LVAPSAQTLKADPLGSTVVLRRTIFLFRMSFPIRVHRVHLFLMQTGGQNSGSVKKLVQEMDEI